FYNVVWQSVGDNRESGYGLAGIAEAAALDSSTATHDLSAYLPNSTSVTYANAAMTVLAAMVDPAGTTQWSGHPANYWYTQQESSGDWPMSFVASSTTS